MFIRFYGYLTWRGPLGTRRCSRCARRRRSASWRHSSARRSSAPSPAAWKNTGWGCPSPRGCAGSPSPASIIRRH
eukprot:4418061-Pyramimonas_sp.AAC.1